MQIGKLFDKFSHNVYGQLFASLYNTANYKIEKQTRYSNHAFLHGHQNTTLARHKKIQLLKNHARFAFGKMAVDIYASQYELKF